MIDVLLCLVGSVIASDRMEAHDGWTRFRGPNGTGVVDGVSFPAAWTDEDYAWRANLRGKGHSSPVVWGNRLYVTSADAESGDVMLTALNTATGKLVWEVPFDLEPYSTHATNSLASCTAAIDEKHVYLPLVSPKSVTVVALTHGGQEVWRRELGSYDAHHGAGISPIVVDGKVILACDHDGESFAIALNTDDGETLWQVEREPCNASYATPAVWMSPRGTEQLILHSTSEGMVGLDAESGKVLWQLQEVFPERCVSSPVVAGGYVFGSSGAGSNGVSLVCVQPGRDASTPAKLMYEVRKSVPQVPTPLAYEDMLFVLHDRGTLSCRDLKSGEEFWTERIGGQYYSSPICVGGKLYCLSDAGEVIVLAAAKEFKELGRTQLPESTHATPAVADRRMFLRTETAVLCLQAE